MREEYFVTANTLEEAKEKALAEFRASFGICEWSHKRVRCEVKFEQAERSHLIEKTVRVN